MHRSGTPALSWRALALLSAATLLFCGAAILWLAHPTDAVGRYVVVPSALVVVFGILGYALASNALAPWQTSRSPLRRPRRR